MTPSVWRQGGEYRTQHWERSRAGTAPRGQSTCTSTAAGRDVFSPCSQQTLLLFDPSKASPGCVAAGRACPNPPRLPREPGAANPGRLCPAAPPGAQRIPGSGEQHPWGTRLPRQQSLCDRNEALLKMCLLFMLQQKLQSVKQNLLQKPGTETLKSQATHDSELGRGQPHKSPGLELKT